MSISNKQRFEVFKRDDFTCQYCGRRPPETVLEVDHIHPRAAGGTDAMSNLRTACWGCNSGKGANPVRRDGVYRLVDGPWSGRSYTFQPNPVGYALPPDYKEYPFLWIVTDNSDEQHSFQDSLLVSETALWPLPTVKLRIGHPWHSSGLRGGNDPEWCWRRREEGLNPRVIGAYLGRPWYEDAPPDVLEWSPADHLIQILA